MDVALGEGALEGSAKMVVLARAIINGFDWLGAFLLFLSGFMLLLIR
ncbi:hypothetical protein [Ventosimonas gracilis]|nr:hypothetical protein [Ventosimonas gracilis]